MSPVYFLSPQNWAYRWNPTIQKHPRFILYLFHVCVIYKRVSMNEKLLSFDTFLSPFNDKWWTSTDKMLFTLHKKCWCLVCFFWTLWTTAEGVGVTVLSALQHQQNFNNSVLWADRPKSNDPWCQGDIVSSIQDWEEKALRYSVFSTCFACLLHNTYEISRKYQYRKFKMDSNSVWKYVQVFN